MTEIPKPETKKVSYDIPVALHDKLVATIPWGVRSEFFRKLIEIALDRIEGGGYVVIGAILSGDYDPLQKRLGEEEED